MSELQKAVADILVKATQAAETAGVFVVEQLPEVARQYVTYKLVEALLWGLFNLILLAGTLFIWLRVRKAYADKNVSGSDYWGCSLIATLVGVLLTWLFMDYMQDAALAYFAPKVLLIEWAAKLVK